MSETMTHRSSAVNTGSALSTLIWDGSDYLMEKS